MEVKIHLATKIQRQFLVECAFFKPEAIMGKSTKYSIQSEASHKFERFVDPECHEYVLRRFIKIVEEHTNIKDVSILFHITIKKITSKIIDFDL